jgi:hypothetical protein
MRFATTALSLIALAGATLLLSSCSAGVHRHPPAHKQVTVVETGPPPHAPAHGYRHKHRGTVIVYEASLGVYVVRDRPDYYFYGEYFYRVRDGGWQASLTMSGPWKVVPDYRLPEKVRHHQYVKAHKHKKKHKRGRR